MKTIGFFLLTVLLLSAGCKKENNPVSNNPAQKTEMTVYNISSSGIPSNNIRSITEDNNGNIWIGTDDNGAAVFSGNGWKIYNMDNSGIPHNWVSSILTNYRNTQTAFLTTYGAGLVEFDGSSDWQVYKNSQMLNTDRKDKNTAVFEYKNELDVASYTGGISVRDINGQWRTYNAGNSALPGNVILPNAYTVDGSNNLWLGCFTEGLARFDGTDWKTYTMTNSGIPRISIAALEHDASGNIWIGTSGEGLIKFDGTSWYIFNTGNSPLPSDYIYDLHTEDNKLWIATGSFGGNGGAGLVKFDGNSWEFFNTDNSGLPDNNLLSVYVDKKGDKWIGTYSGGLAKLPSVK